MKPTSSVWVFGSRCKGSAKGKIGAVGSPPPPLVRGRDPAESESGSSPASGFAASCRASAASGRQRRARPTGGDRRIRPGVRRARGDRHSPPPDRAGPRIVFPFERLWTISLAMSPGPRPEPPPSQPAAVVTDASGPPVLPHHLKHARARGRRKPRRHRVCVGERLS